MEGEEELCFGENEGKFEEWHVAVDSHVVPGSVILTYSSPNDVTHLHKLKATRVATVAKLCPLSKGDPLKQGYVTSPSMSLV